MEPLAWYRIALPIIACLALAGIAAVGHARFRITLLGVLAAVVYAVVQDQVSARLCPEYFTVFHPPIPGLTDPTLLGLTWGFLGAWWPGLLLGYAAGLAATVGRRPPLALRDLMRPVLLLVAIIGAVVAVTGLSVWRHVELLGLRLDPLFVNLLPSERHRALFVVACYHFVAYVTALLGGVALCVWIWMERGRRTRHGAASEKLEPSDEAGTEPSLGAR